MRNVSSLLLLGLTACSSNEDKGTDTTDFDTAEAGDSATDPDTVDTADSATDTGADTDTADSGTPEASPYANCVEEGTDSLPGTWTATYDADGYMAAYVYDFRGSIGTATYDWDDRGNMLEMAVDQGNDGTIDQLTRQAFDDRNHRVLYAVYAGETVLPGAETRTYTYNDDGTETMYLYWDDSWSVLVARYDTSFDGRGNPVAVDVDYEDDGIVDMRRTTTYNYDSAGNALTVELDDQDDGIVDNVRTYTYDSGGRVLTHDQSLPMYPERFLRETWGYDAAGNTVLYTYEATGVSGQRQASRFDDAGREIERTYDVEPYDSVDRTLTWSYTCP